MWGGAARFCVIDCFFLVYFLAMILGHSHL